MSYDLTISPPKSVSIAALVGNDQRIVEAHERAVTMALEQLQSFAATRVRKDGQCTDRATGNIVAATFRHDTSRAVDPHLDVYKRQALNIVPLGHAFAQSAMQPG